MVCESTGRGNAASVPIRKITNIRYPICWESLTKLVGGFNQNLDGRPRLAAGQVCERLQRVVFFAAGSYGFCGRCGIDGRSWIETGRKYTGGKVFLKIEGTYLFHAPRERVWQVLLDPEIMAQCMPGCESMNEVAPDQFEAVMKVGVASVKGTYKGKVAIKDKQAPSHYVLSGQGSGGPGFMQGDVAIDLEEQGGQTVLKYSTDAKIGGLIASLGQRMMNGVAKMMVDQFFKKMETFI
jgi:carbon monoxide dehydrogenase subunit G